MADDIASQEDRERGRAAIQRIREEHGLRPSAPKEPETVGPKVEPEPEPVAE